MRRLAIVLGMLMMAWSAVAQESVWQLLGRVAAYMDSEQGYEVQFDVKAADFASTGSYRVKGESYHIAVADAEVYSDGAVKYEVDNAFKEVNIDVVDRTSHNILDNPTRCFDFVESDYLAEVASRTKDIITLKIKAKDNSIEGEIYLTVLSQTAEPTKVEYVLYGERMEVVVKAIDRKSKSVKKFDKSAYKGYEINDFR